MERRQFLKVTGSAGLMVGLASCGVATTPDDGTSSNGEVTGDGQNGSSQPRLQTVRYAMSAGASSDDTADPHLATSELDSRLAHAVYEQLTGYDEQLAAVPVLAEGWRTNDRGDEWTFDLRRDVVFHNGDRLTAGDVVHSYRRLLDPDVGSPAASLLSFLEPDRIEALDDHTVRFAPTRPMADLPLAIVTKQTFIVPEGATGDDLATEPVGTGAFRLAEFTPGEDTTAFEAHTDYWRQGYPATDGLEIVSITESSSRVAALQRGQVDIIEDPAYADLERVENDEELALVVQEKGNMEVLAMQMDQPPFDDPLVRSAMKHAVDRDKVVDLVTNGRATPIADIPIPPILKYSLQGDPRPHDPERARQLLREAGYQDGLSVQLAVSDIQARFMEIATAFKSLAGDVGIDVELDVRPADSYWGEVWLNEPFFVSAWITRPTPNMLGLLFPSEADWNETNWNRPEWDERFERARQTLDEDDRGSLYRELQQEVVDDGGYIVPYMAPTLSATTTDIEGWKPTGTLGHNFYPIRVRA